MDAFSPSGKPPVKPVVTAVLGRHQQLAVGARSVGGKVFFEGWYVPETRGFVKSTFRDGNGNETFSIVMSDYQR